MRWSMLLPLLAAFACNDAEKDGVTGESAEVPTGPVTLTQQAALPANAPGLVILVALGSDGLVTTDGTVASDTTVDLDRIEDDQWPFRYQVLDADGVILFERTTPGPLQVADFLDYYSAESGYDILSIFPGLGHFPVTVPMLDNAYRVRFQVRDGEGTWANAGSYTLSDASTDDVGVSESVIGSETLYESGPPENALDLVLVGDGYTADEMDKWQSDAAKLSDAILSTEPFASFTDYINIRRVDAVSQESGASYDCVDDDCRLRDTAFGTVFPLDWVNTLLGTDYNARALFQLQQWEVARAVSVVPWDLVVVVVNTSRDGGFSVHYATVTNGSEHFTATAVHELAHMVGLLGDEYVFDDCIVSDSVGLLPNIAEDPENLPWSQWVDADTPLPTPDDGNYLDAVGAFEGAYNCDDLYRPQQTCRMRTSSGGAFCSVCSEQLTRRIFHFADPASAMSWSQDETGATFTVTSPRSDLVLSATDGETVLASGTSEESLFVPAEDLPLAGQTLTVSAQLQTDDVRIDGGDLEQDWTFDVTEGAP